MSCRTLLLVTMLLVVLSGCAQEDTGHTVTPRPSSSMATAGPAGPAMPDVIGKSLPDAKELLAGKGYLSVEAADDSDGQRPIVNPDNWVVRAQTPNAGEPAPSQTPVQLLVSKPTDQHTSQSTPPGVVPNVVCMDLQSAQDALQASGFYYLTSEDAGGQGRKQLVDRNWIVVRQSVGSGQNPAKTDEIRLSAVKIGEPTGTVDCSS